MVRRVFGSYGTGRMQAIRAMISMLALLWLVACRLDDTDSARAVLAEWLWPEQAMYVTSTAKCTAAVFRLDVLGLRPGTVQTRRPRDGIAALQGGQAVAFVGPDLSPDRVSQDVMSADLPTGIGLLSVAMAARPCMTDEIAIGINRLMLQPGVATIYAPSQRVLVLVDASERRAVLMRAGKG